MIMRILATLAAATTSLWLAGCAGPHGERPALDSAVVQPGAANYGFSGGYAGATGGGFR